ncbi:hypothetical protein P154DRAFT_570584 [Amniculicola lignicola CBS 123094]|uniref:Uncharacterized protein n=1 Tax=Amniculicola lignicola CBS 123094 TaxID=1392246 RepID=A0A6A5WVM3_9PLEO|nr:hypothetical protein P154DRAFT_570584 [Amniculicola lignicola CBS 123094]
MQRRVAGQRGSGAVARRLHGERSVSYRRPHHTCMLAEALCGLLLRRARNRGTSPEAHLHHGVLDRRLPALDSFIPRLPLLPITHSLDTPPLRSAHAPALSPRAAQLSCRRHSVLRGRRLTFPCSPRPAPVTTHSQPTPPAPPPHSLAGPAHTRRHPPLAMLSLASTCIAVAHRPTAP